MEKQPFKKLKILSFFTPFFKNKSSCNFQFSIRQDPRQRFVIPENLKYNSQLLLKLRAVEPSFRFFRYRLGHLNNRQAKIAEKSKIHFFES